ncbi:Hypothetical_protein [Hexamita inflata]|uniref:Hypothetical_protein n=1 Tax=Hexamita inflata TaxID=28002 RepID=A0ABP1GV41_9EUKA
MRTVDPDSYTILHQQQMHLQFSSNNYWRFYTVQYRDLILGIYLNKIYDFSVFPPNLFFTVHNSTSQVFVFNKQLFLNDSGTIWIFLSNRFDRFCSVPLGWVSCYMNQIFLFGSESCFELKIDFEAKTINAVFISNSFNEHFENYLFNGQFCLDIESKILFNYDLVQNQFKKPTHAFMRFKVQERNLSRVHVKGAAMIGLDGRAFDSLFTSVQTPIILENKIIIPNIDPVQVVQELFIAENNGIYYMRKKLIDWVCNVYIYEDSEKVLVIDQNAIVYLFDGKNMKKVSSICQFQKLICFGKTTLLVNEQGVHQLTFGQQYNYNLHYIGDFYVFENSMLGFKDNYCVDLTTQQIYTLPHPFVQLISSMDLFMQLDVSAQIELRPEFFSLLQPAFNILELRKRRRQFYLGERMLPQRVPPKFRQFIRPHGDYYLCNGGGFQFTFNNHFVILQKEKSDVLSSSKNWLMNQIVNLNSEQFCISKSALYQIVNDKLITVSKFKTDGENALFVINNKLFVFNSRGVVYIYNNGKLDWFQDFCQFIYLIEYRKQIYILNLQNQIMNVDLDEIFVETLYQENDEDVKIRINGTDNETTHRMMFEIIDGEIIYLKK